MVTWDDDYKIKPLYIMFPKASTYLKSYNGEAKRMYFSIENDELLEIFGIKLAITWNKNLIANWSTVNFFLKPR